MKTGKLPTLIQLNVLPVCVTSSVCPRLYVTVCMSGHVHLCFHVFDYKYNCIFLCVFVYVGFAICETEASY